MAEQFVSKDQFEEFTKRMEQGFHHADQRHNDLLVMIDQRFAQADQRHNDFLAVMNQRHSDMMAAMSQRFDQVDQRVNGLERRMEEGFRTINTAVQRQMWALIAVVLGGAIKVLFFS